ncbi:hypothetical protein B0T24DRAFT_225713 [Lasiosphaeria ovina]|uniref:Uncharacterized protein n=1 Tax=Lasiosphaeria ovina TaxID=92902 RepID=A0AAE0NAW6_9PEZI|nr:hypothetical protein B0T24DRAFT_225713 [Lasiosphaeria ovina]
MWRWVSRVGWVAWQVGYGLHATRFPGPTELGNGHLLRRWDYPEMILDGDALTDAVVYTCRTWCSHAISRRVHLSDNSPGKAT